MNLPQSITIVCLVAFASIHVYNYLTDQEPDVRYVESPSAAARAGPCMTVQGEVDRLCLKRERLQTMSASEAIEFIKNDAELNHIFSDVADQIGREQAARRSVEPVTDGPCVRGISAPGLGITFAAPRVECELIPEEQALMVIKHQLRNKSNEN